jgi:hypothetical protein
LQDATALDPAGFPLNEDFGDNQLHVTGLELTSVSGMGPVIRPGNGHIENDMWVDCVGTNACNNKDHDSTALTLHGGNLMYGIWFDVNTSLSQDGLELWFYNHGHTVDHLSIHGDQRDDGWFDPFSGSIGFLAPSEFDQVFFYEDAGPQSWSMDNLIIWDPTPAPEPVWTAAFGLLLLIVAMKSKRAMSPEREHRP